MNSDRASKAKLSYNLFTDYQSYKESTAVFVRWLIDNGDASHIKNRTLPSVKHLISRAQMAKDNGITVPNHVLQALKHSIKKRGKITNFFRSLQDSDDTVEDEITRSHEHFTATLIDVLNILQRDLSIQSSSIKPIEVISPVPQPSNLFEVLGHEDIEAEDMPENLSTTEEATSGLQTPLSSPHQPTDEQDFIEDDPLDEITEIFRVVLEMDAICSAVKSLWEQAGAGLIPIILASWTSSAALKGVERWLAATTGRLQISEHRTLYSKYVLRLRELHVVLRPNLDIAPKYTPFTAGHGLTTAWIALEAFKSSRQHNEQLMCGRLFEDPATHITIQKIFFDGPRQMEAEHITMDLMLKTMKQLLGNQNRVSSDFILDIKPLLVNVHHFLDSDKQSPTTSLVFGMQLLVESFKSFRFCDSPIQSINCRTLALKFAQEVHGSLNQIIDNESKMHCMCHSCGGNLRGYLLLFKAQLDDYLGQTRFDLYYQTPWVVGQHMQEMLSLATDDGLRLCEQQNYLAAILHLYNLLIQLKVITNKLPLLDSLCSSLRDSVFLGSLPSRNYHSHFVRCLGGRLAFHENSGRHDQAYRLEIPKAVNRGPELTRPPRRLAPSQISRFYDMENRRYAIDIDRWTDIYQAKKDKRATHQEKATLDNMIHNNSFAVSLLKLKDYAAPEFSGDFPIARVNYFAVHLGCLRVLEKIASLEEDHLFTNTKLLPASIGMQLVTELLQNVDECQKNTKTERLPPYLSSLRRSKEALVEVLQEKPLSDFLWQGIAALKG